MWSCFFNLRLNQIGIWPFALSYRPILKNRNRLKQLTPTKTLHRTKNKLSRITQRIYIFSPTRIGNNQINSGPISIGYFYNRYMKFTDKCMSSYLSNSRELYVILFVEFTWSSFHAYFTGGITSCIKHIPNFAHGNIHHIIFKHTRFFFSRNSSTWRLNGSPFTDNYKSAFKF